MRMLGFVWALNNAEDLFMYVKRKNKSINWVSEKYSENSFQNWFSWMKLEFLKGEIYSNSYGKYVFIQQQMIE